MTTTPSKHHLRNEAQKMLLDGGVPERVTPEMAEAAVESSDLQLDVPDEVYGIIVQATRRELVKIFEEDL